MTDLKTDAVYVAGIDRTITKYGHVESNTNSLNQFETALGYADYIQKEFPAAKISVTGHSLGGIGITYKQLIGGKKLFNASLALIPVEVAIWVMTKYRKWMFKYIVWVCSITKLVIG